MDMVLFIGFLAATFLIVVTPGPAVALASSQAIRYGPRAAGVTIAGDALGSVVHILIAVASLKTLIEMAAVILPYLQMAGGVFILYLAWQSWRISGVQQDSSESTATIPKATFFSGFFSCLTNPKAIVFFVALFPGFISPEHSIVTQSLIYGAIFVTLDAAFIFGYALLAMLAFKRTLSGVFSVEKLSAMGLFGVGALLIFKGYKELPTS